jgi:hypothetical protein
VTLILFITLLLASGAPANAPRVGAAAKALGGLDFVDLALLLLGGTALGLLLSPFQVGLVRVLEGYWPPHGPLGVFAEYGRIRHRRRRRELQELEIQGRPLTRWEQRYPQLISKRQAEATRRLAELPYDDDRVLPTRLGNMLRRNEDLAGDRYGLDALEVIPRLYPVAPPAMVELIEEARNEMDVMATFVLIWLIATGFGVYVLRDYGEWLLLPLLTYGLACVSYRASIVAAGLYGRTLIRAVDLYRFEVIEQLRYKPAVWVVDEIRRNRELMEIVTGDRMLAGRPAGDGRLRRYDHKKRHGGL